ncbi:methyltransferase domain-containing protein [Teredinibacter purpureus]|jgi:hypothetical protein|uniref:hypothetical protein n=1 Tax=Teredinibacter purpureus TaxID=2731756 RepID=UPI0005F88BBE|nr:hypothetical protein [Teredinibacter purpureus]
MAIIWQKTVGHRLYQVRTAGATLRLYSNGVFHSQWNPNTPIAGSLWDLLILPSFLHELALVSTGRDTTNRCGLVLGVGGGAVINLLNRYFDFEHIKGVDLDKTHLRIAKKYFIEQPHNVVLAHQCAKAWVAGATTDTYYLGRFDTIVEDLFLDIKQPDGQCLAERVIEPSAHWLSQLYALLAPQGILVINYSSVAQLRGCEATKYAKQNKMFKAIFAFTKPQYHNAIAVYSRLDFNKVRLKNRLLEALSEKSVLPARHRKSIANFTLTRII